MESRNLPWQIGSVACEGCFEVAALKNGDGTPKRCFPHMFRDTFCGRESTGWSPHRPGFSLAGPQEREDSPKSTMRLS